MSQLWFRMYAEAVDDEKLRLLAFEDRWHYVAILCLKALGTLDSEAPFLERRVALKLGMQPALLDEVKRRLIEVQLIDDEWQPIAWDKRQFKSDHDAAERKKKQRNRDRLKDVTTPNSDSHNKVTTPEQNRAEQKQSRAESPATRLPDHFALTEERRKLADAEGLDPIRTLENFRDYWKSVPGSRGRKLDWEATWRKWCRSEYNRPTGKKPAGSPYANAL